MTSQTLANKINELCQKIKTVYQLVISVNPITILGLNVVNPSQIQNRQMGVFLYQPTNELVFMVRDDNSTIRFARLPLNMGPPLGFTPCISPERTLNVQTIPGTLQDILKLRPILGMNYEPSPSDYTSLPPPVQYGDTDFSNADFEGLWGDTLNVGSGSCTTAEARNDIVNMKQDLNVNYVRFFNLNQEAFRNHVAFADYCETNNVSITWPLDFWVNFTGDPSLVVTLIKTLGAHPATIGWRLGNELNGTTEATKIAKLFKTVVQNDPMKHAISSSLQEQFFPSMSTLIRNAIVALGLEQEYEDHWFQMVNVYPSDPVNSPTMELDMVINTLWPGSDFANQPLLITEYGTACNVSDAIQVSAVQAQAQFIKDAATNSGKPLFLGGCLFKYTNELWKTTDPSCQQDELGINEFAGTFCTATQISSTNLYRVDDLTKKPAYASYKSVVNP